MPLASPQSVIDRWRELVRIIVLDSVPESPRKQEVLEQLERLQDASTLRTLACHSFEGQLEVARTNAGRRTRSSVPEQGPRQQQLQLQQPQQYVLNSNVSSSNPSSAAPAAPAAIATRPIVAQGGDHQQLRQQLRGVPAILSIGDNANSNANGHAGGSEGFLLGARAGARAGADDVEQTAVAEAAPSAFVLRRLGSDKGSDKGGASRAGMGAREKVENGGSGVGEVGGHARGVERSSSAKEPSAREGAGGGDDNFSIAELAFVQEHWQDGVCTLHHLEDGVADGEVQGASGALALRRLVKCRGVDVKAGMTKAQLEADLRKAAKNGTLPDSGSFSFDIPEIVPAPSSQTQATVEAATASSLAVEGEEMEPSSSEQWCVEGQIVWVRGAFVAYMDGQAIEDNDVWCPGLVCVRMADPESGEGKGDPEAGSPGFVVDVLGQSQAEFEVEGDNLTGFPGHGENLETVRDSADSGLGSPPDHMSLAVGQAILACLKCGWDPQRGTNILRPTLCNDQDQGDARVKTYAKAWGIDPVKLEDLLKLSWQLMRPVPRGQESARRDHESGDWEHLRATWRKIERMWRGASSIERPSAGGSSSGGAKSVREAVLAEGVAVDGSAEGKAAMPSGDGSREEEKGEGVRRNGGVAVATVMPSEEKGREGEEEEGGDAGGTRALSDKPRRSSPSQTGDGEATSPSFREGSESARKSDGGDRRGESKEIAEGASNSASAKDGGKGRPASPSAPAGSAGQGESSAADSKPLPSPFLLPLPPPLHPVGSSASDGDASGADAAGAAGAIETNRATVAAQGRVFSLPSDGAGVTGRTALKRSANEGKEGEEGGGAGQVAIERDAKRAKAGPSKSIEGSTARTASPGTTNSSSGGGGGSGSDAHSTTVTATGASSNAAGDATGDLEPGSKVAGEVGATAVTSVPGSDGSGGSYGLATMRNSIQAKGNGETASDGGGKQYALPTSTETVEAAAEKLAGPATAAGKAAAISKGADGFTTPAERAIAGADAPTPMTGSPASDDRARPTSGSQAGSKNKDVVSRPSGVPGEKAVRDPSSMPGGSHSPAAPPLPPRKILAASGEASGVPDGEKDRQQPWRGSAETLPRRGRKFETPPEFNENDFRDRTPRANGGHGVRVA